MKTKMGMAGLIFELRTPNLKINTTFTKVQMMLKKLFDFSNGFRFSKISVECSIHLCSCPWTVTYVLLSKYHYVPNWWFSYENWFFSTLIFEKKNLVKIHFRYCSFIIYLGKLQYLTVLMTSVNSKWTISPILICSANSI